MTCGCPTVACLAARRKKKVASGSAYGICGCARFHKLHEIWCPETQMLRPELSIKGGEGRTNAPARVGLT